MRLRSHTLELDIDGRRCSVRFARDEATKVTLAGTVVGAIDDVEMETALSGPGSLDRRAAALADRIEAIIGERLPGRERMVLVATVRFWLREGVAHEARVIRPAAVSWTGFEPMAGQAA
jgi:hypothetical protein